MGMLEDNIFADTFKIADPILRGILNIHAIECLADRYKVEALRQEMLTDGITIDGLMRKPGSLGLIFDTESPDKEGIARKIEGAITRIENMATFEHPIILRSVFRKEYQDKEYEVHIVPNAPDLHIDEEGRKIEITKDDIRRTMQVLKADGQAHHLWDYDPDNFVFLKGTNGKVLRYPSSDDTHPYFRDKPIAFVRDLNAAPMKLDKNKAGKRLEAFLGHPVINLPDAPRACVDACKQQYLVAAPLVKQLQAYLTEEGKKYIRNVPEIPVQQETDKSSERWVDSFLSGRNGLSGEKGPLVPPSRF